MIHKWATATDLKHEAEQVQGIRHWFYTTYSCNDKWLCLHKFLWKQTINKIHWKSVKVRIVIQAISTIQVDTVRDDKVMVSFCLYWEGLCLEHASIFQPSKLIKTCIYILNHPSYQISAHTNLEIFCIAETLTPSRNLGLFKSLYKFSGSCN